jgi:hypothetical protein
LHRDLRVTACTGAFIGVSGGFEERAMSTVGASNSNNPYAQLQALWQRGQSQSSTAQGDAPSQSFAPTSSQKTNVSSPPPAASSSAKPTTSAGTFPRFEPQTLQMLIALQASDNNR